MHRSRSVNRSSRSVNLKSGRGHPGTKEVDNKIDDMVSCRSTNEAGIRVDLRVLIPTVFEARWLTSSGKVW